MPGGRGFVDSPNWFQDKFGFEETSFGQTQARFEFADGVLKSTANGAQFYVGDFETPSLDELRQRVAAGAPAGGLSFDNVCGNAMSMHLDAANAGQVFQVASQFNCLEMVGPGTRPEDGVTRYYCDATQGPACALSCPAATVYRNYFVNGGRGQAGKNQIDCLSDVAELVRNDKEGYWKMANGYVMPPNRGAMRRLTEQMKADADLTEAIRSRVRIGVHWDTEVKTGGHRVCQVFSSAVPVSYTKSTTNSTDWQPFAQAVLDATYEATLAVATLVAARRQERVTVFLTAVGGGAFGNRSHWIVNALEKALIAYATAPLDVKMVSFGTKARSTFEALERGRKPKASPEFTRAAGAPAAPAEMASVPAAGTSTTAVAGASSPQVDQEEDAPAAATFDTPASAETRATAENITAAFSVLDADGDGIVHRDELTKVLTSLDPEFTEETCREVFEAADADHNGEIHYAEFVAWICAADAAATSAILRVANTGHAK